MCRFLLFLNFMIVFSPEYVYAENENTNTPLADAYIEKHGIKNSVAQLLITGIIADYNNVKTNRKTKELLELNIGGIMINSYNLPSESLSKTENREQALQIIKDFTTTLRRKHRDGSNLLFAADFESYRFSSIRYPLIPPPSAMTITANNSTKIAHDIGIDVGKQLKSVGVNVLLGPVFDKDVDTQGFRNTNLLNRSFSGSEKIISILASEFIRGVQKYDVSVIAKHFPGYGFAERNPHYEKEVGINATSDTVISNLSPFKETSHLISGLMTSHLHFNKSSRPLTVSKKGLESLFSHEKLSDLKNKIIITDDISNMASISDYKEKSKISNAKLVLDAFEAGHDLILISHLEQHSGNKFTLEDVKESIEELVSYSSKEQGLLRIKLSLEKVLKLKSRAYHPQTKGLSGDEIYSIHDNFMQVLLNGTIRISSSFENHKLNFIDEVEPSKKVIVVGEDKFFPEMQDVISENGLVEYIELSSFKDKKLSVDKQISRMGEKISSIVDSGNYLVFLVSTLDSYNILDSLRFNNIDSSKVLISVHGTPMPIKTENLLYFNVITNFDDSPYSSRPAALILKGIVEPGELRRSPVEIGTGAIFKLENRLEIIYDVNDGEIAKGLSKNLKKSSGNILVYGLLFLFLAAVVILSLSIFSCHAKQCDEVTSRKIFWKEALLSKRYFYRKSIIIILFMFTFSLPILAANPGEFSKIVSTSDYEVKTTVVKKMFDLLVWLDQIIIKVLSVLP